jgi:L-seryl-tRNA(Ser) seleniumtransferase
MPRDQAAEQSRATSLFRAIPSVDQLLHMVEGEPDLAGVPRTMIKELINAYQDECRSRIRSGALERADQLRADVLKPDLVRFISRRSRPKFRRVINATGVVVHTNLGRSLLADSAIESVAQVCAGYSNLEFDLETGKRGSRYSLVEDLLCDVAGAEAGLVVNNNAAAVLLMLDTLASGKEVVVSRGQLVEIGGSFRIPEVMAKSGAVLKEVGATNRTHLFDYERAIGPDTAAILKVHTSNYRIVGFSKEVGLSELVELGNRYDLPVLEDLGSGNFFRFPPYTRMDEPTVQDVLRTGVSAVCFSGDKLLGGPQAGIILGKREYIEKIKKNPLNRALRIDKMTLAGLEATLRLYKDMESAADRVPTLSMICATPESLRRRAKRLASTIRQRLGDRFDVSTFAGSSRVGGGASPELDLPSHLVGLKPRSTPDPETLRRRLLQTDPPLVGRIEHDQLCLDPRTILGREMARIPAVLQQALEMDS